MPHSADLQTSAPPLTGEIAYIFAYDIAYDMSRPPEGSIMGQPIVPYLENLGKRGPRAPMFYRPQMVLLPDVQRRGPAGAGPVTIKRAVKFFPVGALSITYRIPFTVAAIEDLVAFHEPRLDGVTLDDEVLLLAGRIRDELAPFIIRPVAQLRDEEAYTIFCLNGPLHDSAGAPCSAEHWLADHRRSVAALLTQEPDPSLLSDQETADTTTRCLSYYQNDLAVVDWDAALMVEDPQNIGPTLHIMELANVQLAELEAYDRILDDSLQRSYRDMRRSRLGGRPGVLAALREYRIDLARLSDEISNNTKFFGDWHLARVYQMTSDRFHLAEWHRNIDNKLNTLDRLYQLLKQDQMNGWMMVLEVTIVVLFIIDLIILVAVSR